ncbi:MAG: DUF4386 family protein [Actinomycetota bacterium]
MVGSFGYVADLVTNVLFPTVAETLTPVLVLPSALAEVSLVLWLLVKGLNVQQPADHVPPRPSTSPPRPDRTDNQHGGEHLEGDHLSPLRRTRRPRVPGGRRARRARRRRAGARPRRLRQPA